MFTGEGAEPPAGLLHPRPLSSQAPRAAILVVLRHSPADSQSSISTIHDPLSGICFQPNQAASAGEKQTLSQQHWDLFSFFTVSSSSLILPSFSSLGKLWWLARMFSTRNRDASSMFMLSCSAETTRINSQDQYS